MYLVHIYVYTWLLYIFGGQTSEVLYSLLLYTPICMYTLLYVYISSPYSRSPISSLYMLSPSPILHPLYLDIHISLPFYTISPISPYPYTISPKYISYTISLAILFRSTLPLPSTISPLLYYIPFFAIGFLSLSLPVFLLIYRIYLYSISSRVYAVSKKYLISCLSTLSTMSHTLYLYSCFSGFIYV